VATRPDLFAAWREQPQRAGVMLDFDGTLAEIVTQPEDARPLPAAVEVLGVLCLRFGRVAVVSGRPVAFLHEHLDVPGLVLSGLYGLESWRDGEVVVHPDAVVWRPVVAALADRAQAELPSGVGVERKGLSFGLHVRARPEYEDTVRAWSAAAADDSGLELHEARRSFELRPPLDVDKGSAVMALAEGLDAACFVGDDRGDLPAFAALDRLAESDGVTVVRVVAASDETPASLLAEADVVVEGPRGALELLRELAS
jgi:trehalose 6-phosphate phosphatase